MQYDISVMMIGIKKKKYNHLVLSVLITMLALHIFCYMLDLFATKPKQLLEQTLK